MVIKFFIYFNLIPLKLISITFKFKSLFRMLNKVIKIRDETIFVIIFVVITAVTVMLAVSYK